ncbi:hypothetical protein [Desulforhopalus singaporensis]|uniref:Repeat domain-containing protein n=1 Tax=Desulforhopalus singaporensis TaxID=91360 RepID=A0A1H0VU39_9BACT|nr:hypothetical protein [Desulforhopalus singaporensis]SDP81894.1 hypothetical protein SAMN05660330_04235 [Desulforhopalus singaporensis]
MNASKNLAVLVFLLFLLVGCAQQHTINNELFPKTEVISELLLPDIELKIVCQKQKDSVYVSYIGDEKGKILLVVFTHEKFKEPRKNIYAGTTSGGLPPGATLNWGYVFDRNHDGKVDYLSFLDGGNVVVPDGWQGDLPNLNKAITAEELKFIMANMRLVFWHMVDDNFDGFPDRVIVSLRNIDNGLIDGLMDARDSDFDGNFDFCKSYQGNFSYENGDCIKSENGYKVQGKQISGLQEVPPNSKPSFYRIMNEVADECNLSDDSYYY